MDPTTIIVAAIAAAGPTLTGYAALQAAKKAARQTATSNGHTAGQLSELTHQEVAALSRVFTLHAEEDRRQFQEIVSRLDSLETR